MKSSRNNPLESILVTGGTGFIGSHLVDRLLARGARVTVLDNFNDFYDPRIKRANIASHLDFQGYTLVEGDIRVPGTVNQTFAKGGFHLVIHLAAMAGVRPSVENPALYHEVNLIGTMNVLEAIRQYGVPKLVFASSSSVYGNNTKVPFAESDPVDHPISPYAATKKAGELMAHTYHHLYGINTACLRFFTVYGPRQRPEMAICKFTDRITRGQEIDVYAEGHSRRDYTYIDDIIDGVMAACDADLEYEIINLGRSDTVGLLDLITKLEKLLGKKAKTRLMPSQPGDVEQTYADITKARRLLGFQPRVSIDTGLARFAEWYLNRRGSK
ncbi:MAG: GDP-mannose 4,6-dehydratase [Candidatus Zixiibacteriota bacterium]